MSLALQSEDLKICSAAGFRILRLETLQVVMADYVQQNVGIPSSARPLRGEVVTVSVDLACM